jgi:DcuC family C4-dicarboxylate transporter
MNTVGLIIAIAIIIWAGYCIAKKGYAAATLLIAGVALLAFSVLLGTEPGLALKKGTGSVFFDIFKIVEDVFKTTLGGLGLNIMIMGGFAKYMDQLNAGRALYDVVSGPLKYIKNPYLLACMGYLISQIMGMAIPSAAALGLMLMVTLYPVLIRAGVSRMTAVCTIAASRFFDLGPGSANCMMTAKVSGIEWAEYFLSYQMKIYWPMLAVLLISLYFSQRYWDKKEGPDPEYEALRLKFQQEADSSSSTPKIYALLPMIPLVILLVFNPVVIGHWGIKIKVGVPAAIVLSTLIAMAFEYIRTRKGLDVLNGLKVFFQGMGSTFAIVVSLIVAGQVFGKGLISIGAVNAMISGVESVGLGVGFLVIMMGLVICLVSFLMGSGNAPFFSFAAIVPEIAARYGVNVASMLLPLQTMTGLGRTMSPVTGAIVAVSGIAGVSPFQVVKRNMVPMLIQIVVAYIMTFAVIL